jgi:hypothetical protein
MSFTSPTLKTQVVARVHDESTELADYLDTAIDLAELRLSRDLAQVTAFDVTATGAFTAASPYVTKPTGWIVPRFFRYRTTATGKWQRLAVKSLEYCQEFWPNENLTATAPRYYADYDATRLYVAGVPAGTYAWQHGYKRRLPGLATDNPTNWTTQDGADALFNAVCLECAIFKRNAKMIEEFTAFYGTAIQAIVNEHSRTLRDDNRPADNVVDVENIGVVARGGS